MELWFGDFRDIILFQCLFFYMTFEAVDGVRMPEPIAM
jgi:hypothetical protein